MFEFRHCHHSGLFLLFFLLLILFSKNIYAGQSDEFIRDGGFELGIVDVDIVRFPRYRTGNKNNLTFPTRDSENPMSGDYSLRLPGLSKGGYRFIYPVVPLISGKHYKVSLDIRVTNSTSVRIEAFTGVKRVGDKQVNLKPGKQHINLNFIAATKPLIKENEVPVFIRIWINNKYPVWLDNISLRGPSGASGTPPKLNAWLESDKNIAVYPVNGKANFTFRTPACERCQISYQILNPITNATIAMGPLKTRRQNNTFISKIPLILTDRGFYWVKVQVSDQENQLITETKHSYVVISPDPTQTSGYQRFGMAMEEYGQTTQIDAFTYPDEYYKLAQQIGVGSVRIFSLLMPDMVSSDGIRFNFSEADSAIALMNKYNIEPMIVLGSNNIYRIAPWLRDSKPGKNSIDLLKGLRTPANRKRFKRTDKYGQYLSLSKYKIYLESVFTHFKGKIKYYELWNEPGHKFLTEDFIRIARLTRKVQQRIAPDSFLVGYSSTRRGQLGAGKNPEILPKFLQEVQIAGGIENIDILSYHSEHAFPFMHEDSDHRDQETKYVPRLKTILAQGNKVDMPVWDTERGIPWISPHKERLDYKAGTKRWKHARRSESVFDSARQLPMVYAAAFSSNVKRLFWFYLESSSGTIQRASRRWGFFDAQREPMPHIPIYDAMTEILQETAFDKLIESKGGGRAYVFHNPDYLVILAYNWQGNTSTLQIPSQIQNGIKLLDIMGNPSKLPGSIDTHIEVPIHLWPQYILLPLNSEISSIHVKD